MERPGIELARLIVDVLDEKKGEEIVLLDLTGLCSFADYFVICTGVSERTINALADEVRRQVKAAAGELPRGTEGRAENGWVLMDYGAVILHLFSAQLRAYYRLEDLWREGQVLVRMP